MSNHTKKAPRKDPSVNLRTSPVEVASETNGGRAPIDEQIRLRAYELYIERGAQPNDDLGDWLRAERELDEGRAERASPDALDT